MVYANHPTLRSNIIKPKCPKRAEHGACLLVMLAPFHFSSFANAIFLLKPPGHLRPALHLPEAAPNRTPSRIICSNGNHFRQFPQRRHPSQLPRFCRNDFFRLLWHTPLLWRVVFP